ncbi:H-type small acid-soluble spore protein [Oceanobacillus piezotolerans]|uniref:Small, acid-soluble spore protein H n=1 Tax=Oceanobacillus piezotolerans TaxID=2448030 RepID=A0A498DFD1_9BACI|nr:H-type small acid-soluble spore protein [Oceanobacillus piezotolerans]RLL42718.1 H-type small acid-soluble spore protein [Oceanobacillus piezotolerans]
MDKQRALEIVESPELIRVTYNGKQIYIQHVDENTDKARIYPLDDPQEEFDVNLSQLIEQ